MGLASDGKSLFLRLICVIIYQKLFKILVFFVYLRQINHTNVWQNITLQRRRKKLLPTGAL